MNGSLTAADGGLAKAGVAESVAIEQVKLLYANLPVSQSVALVNGFVLALVQAMVIELRQVVTWLVCLVLVALARALLGIRFANRSLSTESAARWRNLFFAGVVAAALVWAASVYFLYPPASSAHQVFLAFVLGGMVAGSVALLTPVLVAFVVFACVVLLPIIARFAIAGDEIHYAMAAMAGVFLVAMLAIGRLIHRTLEESLELRFENRDLIAHLTEEKARVDSVNASIISAQEALRRANEALEGRVAERTAELEEQDRRKSEFLAMLSHELRNPLAPMANALYLLKTTEPGGSALPHAQGVIERQLEQLVRLVDDLLDVSRINRGRIELRRERVDLAEVIQRAAETAQPLLDQRGHVLDVKLPDESLHVVGDPIRLAQAVSNVLMNAAKYTPQPGHVMLTLAREEGQAVITVKDLGVGITAELLPRVFDLFVQGESGSRGQGGLGIGLTLVQQLVKLHGGEVRAFSRGPGQGSEFTIRLPLAPRAELARPKGETVPRRRLAPPRRVLVVDDNVDAANTLCRILEKFGHEVACVYDGHSALSFVESLPPDVILLDIALPGMDGYEVARMIRANPALRDIKLVAVTGYGQSADRLRSEQAGFDYHLTKPVDAAMLDELINGLRSATA